MKKSALLLAGVMTASIAIVPLAACSAPKGSEFNVENYAKSITEYSKGFQLNERLSFTDISTLDYGVKTLRSKRLLAARGTGDNATKFQLIDSKTDSAVFSTWYDNIEYMDSSWNLDGEYLAIRLVSIGDTVTFNKFVGPDGKLLTNNAVYIPSYYGWENELFTCESHNIEGEKDKVRVYVFTYYTVDENGMKSDEENKKYFTYLKNKDGEFVWKEVNESELDPSNDEYELGTQVGLVKKDLADFMYKDEKDYPNYPYFDYSISFEGNKESETELLSGSYTFWQNGTEKGSVKIENGNVLALAGENAFFYEIAPVSSDAKSGYNLEISYGVATMKAQYTLYSYNFVKGGKAKTVQTDYILTRSATQLFYNYNANLFDMWSVNGAYKMEKGVAVVNAYTKSYSLMLDSKGHVSADLTDKSIGDEFYKLSDGLYLSGGALVDGKLNTVATFEYDPNFGTERPYLWESAELLRVYTPGGYAYIDYTGKVAIAPVDHSYDDVYYFDDVMVANVDGESMVYSKMTPKGMPEEDLVNYDKEKDGISYYGSYGLNLIVKRVTVEAANSGDSNTYTYSLYNYDGSRIGSDMSGYTSMSFGSPIVVGEKLYVQMTKDNKTVTVVLK